MVQRPFNAMQHNTIAKVTNLGAAPRMAGVRTLRVVAALLVFAFWFICGLNQNDVLAQSVRETSPTELRESTLDLHLRVVWGGSTEVSYSGTLEIDQGRMTCEQQLGIDPYDAGFLNASSNSRINFDDERTRFGGCDLHILAPAGTQLTIRLRAIDAVSGNGPANAITPREFNWSLSELREHSYTEKLDVGDCKLSIDRVPGDRLRIQTGRSHMIYNSEEPLSLHIKPCELPWSATQGILEYSIVRVDNNRELARRSLPVVLDGSGNAESIKIVQSAPRDEGVYELRCTLEPRRILPGLLLRVPAVERRVQFVVYNSPPTSIPTTRSHADQEIGSSTVSTWKHLPEVPRDSFHIHLQSEELLDHLEANKRFPILQAARSLAFGRKTSELQSQLNADGTLSLAPGQLATVTLSGLVPNRLHRVVIAAQGSCPQFQAVVSGDASTSKKKPLKSILASERFDLLPQRVLHRELQSSGPIGDESLEMLFWPNTAQATLDVTNLSSSIALDVRSVRVSQLVSDSNSPVAIQRGVQKYVDRAGVLEYHASSIRGVFGDAPHSGGYDGWQLFMNFAESVAQYTQAHGFKSFAMIVDGQGGTLYPSDKLSSNCRLDTGTFSSDGRDPMRKDIVELMYRCLGRNGVQFVPMLELSGSIRDLETDESLNDPEMFQRKSLPKHNAQETARYNPLSARVQRAMSDCIDELDARYRSHVCYAGLAINMTESSHLRVSPELTDSNPVIAERFHRELEDGLTRSEMPRDRLHGSQMQSQYQHWLNQSICTYLKRLRANPVWITTDHKLFAGDDETPLVSPLRVGDLAFEHARLKSQVLNQWFTHSPSPVHIAFGRFSPRYDSSLKSLIEISQKRQKRGQTPFLHAVPQREAAKSLSRVRVWLLDDSSRSILVTNSNAVAETIAIGWNSIPLNFRIRSTLSPALESAQPWIESTGNSQEWRITVPAGEAFRIQWQASGRTGSEIENDSRPLYWYSFDRLTVQALEAGLQILENAVNRLSVPQARIDTINNSGFENSTSSLRRGGLDGWSTSLDPDSSVITEKSFAAEGKACLKLELNKPTSIAWLQSDPFVLTAIEHLSIAFQAYSTNLPEQMVVSLWRFDSKTERFDKLEARDFSEQLRQTQNENAAKWQTIRVDIHETAKPQSKTFHAHSSYNQLYRLQFEAVGSGRLWLDDVTVSTEFLRDDERRKLRSELFLAKTSFQNGDFSPAIQLLSNMQGQWLRWGIPDNLDSHKLVSRIAQPTEASDQRVEQKRSESDRPEPKATKRWRYSWWPSRTK
ncbi:MAG: hypothetical protein ABL921_19020 [Pirellula sp.]